MKKIRIFATALLLAFTLSSCESFFDVELDDQAKIEDIIMPEIIKIAAQMYLENKKDERYRTITQEVNTQE